MKNRIVGKATAAFLLALVLLFSMVGCGPQVQNVTEPSSSVESSEPASSAESASSEEQDLPVGVIAETEDTITYDDMLAGEVTIQKRPQRVVVMLNAVMELWYMAGGTAVARIEGEDNIPEEAKDLPTIGTMSTPSVEKIVSYEPDLVILVNTLTKNREIQPALQEAEGDDSLCNGQVREGWCSRKCDRRYAGTPWRSKHHRRRGGKRPIHGRLQHGEGTGKQPGCFVYPDGERRKKGGTKCFG